MADIKRWAVTEPWLDAHCALGEGPLYEKATNTLRFVDIIKGQVLSVSMSEGAPSLTRVQLDTPVTVTSDIEGVDPQDRILIGVKYGIAVMDRRTGKYEMLKPFSDTGNDRLRSNEGASDPNGRFWLGTMTDHGLGEFQREGALYHFSAGGERETFLDPIGIPNGIGWSPDSRIMYWTDSMSKTIYKLDYDPSTGAVSNRRVFYEHKDPGVPDGLRVDVEGCLWVAVWGGYRMMRLDPQGRLVGEISVPTRCVTCPQFVGTEVVITTAADEEADKEDTEKSRLSKALGGAVFKLDVGVEGVDLFPYKMQ